MTATAAIGRLLAEIAGGGSETVAVLARRVGLPRSSLYALAARLTEAGLIERDAAGRVSAGPACGRIGFAACGLAPLHPVAEALLPVLRDTVDGSVSLVALHPGGEIILMHRRATWRAAQGEAVAEIARDIRAPDGAAAARLLVVLHANLGAAEQAAARAGLDRVGAVLEAALQAAGAAHGAA